MQQFLQALDQERPQESQESAEKTDDGTWDYVEGDPEERTSWVDHRDPWFTLDSTL
ncbi:hypothetical protein BDM02DRAFT_3118116 [Thelephora ganbajun]|uniref:Uncharacterized protein n=1 Tax=Thelephora ganbajun TaxID=370292 RepID=A0ACB6ZBP7_THEGA|nr:hypothetical protein BDM02DRAFT_3118116 [Thelephora ganbajun]